MIERAIKPREDGFLVVTYMNRTLAETIHFANLERYSFEVFGLVLMSARGRRVIPWTQIRELTECFNTEEYIELLKEWQELDHPHHTEEQPDPQCGMCQETQVQNSLPHMIWMRPSE